MAGLLSSLAGKPAVVVTVAVGAIAGGLAATGVFGPDEAAETPAAVAVPAETSSDTAPQSTEPPAADTASVVPTEDVNATPAAPALAAPTFDVVRIEADGSALIAGSAAPGASVTLSLDGETLEQAEADSSGKFAAFLSIDPSAATRVLTLEASLGDQTQAAEDQVIVAAAPPATEIVETAESVAPAPEATPPETDQSAASDAAPAETNETAPSPSDDAPQIAADVSAPDQPPSSDAQAEVAPVEDTSPSNTSGGAAAQPTVTAAAPQAPGTDQTSPAPQPSIGSDAAPILAAPAEPVLPQPASSAPQAPTVFLASRDGVRVLQTPQAPQRGPAAETSLALDSISYSDAGDVALAGRGDQGEFVRIYLDNAPVTTSRIAQDGAWQVDLPQVDTGVYTLRVDVVDAEGAVTSRVETPFKRESDAVLARAAALAEASDAPITAVTVQPGSTLWAIAEQRYGVGVEYVRVFEANKAQIRNPDLIYPGQVFAIPD